MTYKGAIKQLCEMRDNIWMPEFFKPYFDKIIETLTADVRENVKGKWLQHTIDGNVWSIDKDTCSVCKETFYQISETGCVWNFCPNCGADMRGDKA